MALSSHDQAQLISIWANLAFHNSVGVAWIADGIQNELQTTLLCSNMDCIADESLVQV
jgi:hypothetical protein